MRSTSGDVCASPTTSLWPTGATVGTSEAPLEEILWLFRWSGPAIADVRVNPTASLRPSRRGGTWSATGCAAPAGPLSQVVDDASLGYKGAESSLRSAYIRLTYCIGGEISTSSTTSLNSTCGDSPLKCRGGAGGTLSGKTAGDFSLSTTFRDRSVNPPGNGGYPDPSDSKVFPGGATCRSLYGGGTRSTAGGDASLNCTGDADTMKLTLVLNLTAMGAWMSTTGGNISSNLVTSLGGGL